MRILCQAFALLSFCATAHADILLGVAGPLTGQYANLGQQMLTGAQAAVDDLNAKGGLLGQSLRIMAQDDACDIRKAEDVAQKFIDAHVNAVIGHYCSNAALAAARLYEPAGLVMIAPSSSLASLTSAGLANVVRLSPRDDAQGALAARRIIEKRGNAKVALLSDGTEATKGLAASFSGALPNALKLSFKPDAADFSDIIAKMKAANIDAIYFACGATDAGHIAAQAAKAGLQSLRYGPDALVSDLYGQAAGPASEGTIVSFPMDPLLPAQSRQVARALKLAGQSAEGATLPAYAGVQLFAAGAAATNSTNGTTIAQWLKSGASIDTVEGSFTFDKNGDATNPRYSWYFWSNGAYQALPEGN